MNEVTIVFGGMSDRPDSRINNLTPFEAARTPFMDYLAENGTSGYEQTEYANAEDLSVLSVFGLKTDVHNVGRASFESRYFGIDTEPEDAVLCCTFVSLSDDEDYNDKTMLGICHDIEEEEARQLTEDLSKAINNEIFSLQYGGGSEHFLIWKQGEPNPGRLYSPQSVLGMNICDFMPVGEFTDPLTDIMKKSSVVLQEHPVNIARINAGKLPVSSLWLWGIGKPVPENQYQNSENCHTLTVSDDLLVCSVAAYAGSDTVCIQEEQLSETAVNALKNGIKRLIVYGRQPKDFGLSGDLKGKISCIEKIDSGPVSAIYQYLRQSGEAYSLKITSDCTVSVSLCSYCGDPVRYIVYESQNA